MTELEVRKFGGSFKDLVISARRLGNKWIVLRNKNSVAFRMQSTGVLYEIDICKVPLHTRRQLKDNNHCLYIG